MSKRLLVSCLLLAGIALASPCARAEEDAVEFFNNINVTPETPVNDAVCFFCNVRVDGKATGDIVVFFGNVRLNGQAQHDVVDFFGNVQALDGSSIGGDLVNFFGSIHLGQNVSVKQDMVAMFGSVHRDDSAIVGGDHVVFSPWIFFGPLLFFVLVIYLIAHELRARRIRRFAQGYPVPPPFQPR